MAKTQEKDTDFISQDDIDSLLAQAEEEQLEAENTAADAMLAETEDSDDQTLAEAEVDSDSDSEIASGTSGDEEDPAPVTDGVGVEEKDGAISDRVILEDVPDEPDVSEGPGDSAPPAVQKRRWGIQKMLLAASPVVLIIFGGLGVVLFRYMGEPVDDGRQTVQSYSIAPQESGKKPETVKILKEVLNLDAPAPVTASHFIELKKFLVPAPTQRKDLTYVTADISLALTTSSATRLIKDHPAFYRNIIYDVLKQVLTVRDKSKINEISLKIAILKALNGALPERSIKDVIVSTFLMY